jgi:pimeloyl-ACP methyl ester carboxylesterase
LLLLFLEMRTARVVAGAIAAVVGVVALFVWSRYSADLAAQRARIGHGSQVWTSPRFGPIEFASVGQGPPVLVSHGAGGGFDQVAEAAARLGDAGYHVISPSRFGYLRSFSPDDPSPANQAEAYVALLDEQRIPRAAVVGISAGALSALQFAVRHPDRLRSLILVVPAAAAATGQQGTLPAQSPITEAIARRLIRSDFLYWLGIEIAPRAMTRSILATDPALLTAASASERRRARDVMWNVLPVSARAQGLLNDAHFVTTPDPVALDRIAAPTLVISLEDDFYKTIEPARAIAAAIPGAHLVTYPSGGHVWVGRDDEIFAEIVAFLAANSD